MPAFLQSFIEAEQERSRRIEQLRKEIREFAKEEAGSSITEQILLFLADEMVEHLSEIDYELRMKFELYITPLIKRNYIYRYTGTFDRIRQAYIRERMKTPAGQRECEWKYKNEILFVPYHSDPVIVKSVETVRCRSNMVWNFKAAASEKLKRQIFTVLEYILKNYEISRLREYKLTGLQLLRILHPGADYRYPASGAGTGNSISGLPEAESRERATAKTTEEHCGNCP